MPDVESSLRRESEQERIVAVKRAKQRTLAQLRQTTQFMTEDEVRRYVDDVLREVKSDEP